MVELELIEAHYGDRCAERSQVPLINHIYEGLRILDAIGASDHAKRAYCLHPLLQADLDLKESWEDRWPVRINSLAPRIVLLAMEYRNQANAWLSNKVENHSVYSYSGPEPRLIRKDYRLVGEPSPGPLKEVKDMLIADKVQNRKDFERHHKGTHSRSDELEIYFKAWLAVLGVSVRRYQELVEVADGR